MHYLDALCEALLADASIRRALVVRPSSGVYATATHYRVAVSNSDPETRARRYHLVSVERTPYLDSTLARASSGATLQQLAAALVADDPEVGTDDAEAFVDEVLSTQLLVADLAPAITGPEALGRLVTTLREIAPEPARNAAAALADVAESLRVLDAGGLGQDPARYRAIASALEPLPARAELARLFQVDLYKPVERAQLGPQVVRAIERAVGLVAQLGEVPTNEGLRRFRDAFVERYESREVPLVQALDDELGIGFGAGPGGGAEPSPLLEGLPFSGEPEVQRAPMGRRERHLLSGLDATIRTGALEWSLGPEDVEALGAATPASLPDAFSFFGWISADSAEAADRGELLVHPSVIGGPSGANLLGRFCHGDRPLAGHVRDHLRAEEALRPDAVFAEIVHLPEGRHGNILGRPCLRDFEIVYATSRSSIWGPPVPRRLAGSGSTISRSRFAATASCCGRSGSGARCCPA
jgi:hypothetical protein